MTIQIWYSILLLLVSIITLFSLLSLSDLKSGLHNNSLTKLNPKSTNFKPPTRSTTAHATTKSTTAHSIDLINSHFQNYISLDPIVYIVVSQLILRYVSTYIYDSFVFSFQFSLSICIYFCECNFICFHNNLFKFCCIWYWSIC